MVAALVWCGAFLLAPSAGARPHCAGKVATVAKHGGRIKGTARPDVIVGGAGPDQISSGGGRDLICSGGGADIINGGTGRDRILAGAGNDTIIGGPGGEVAIGGSGDDRLYGGQQDDRLIGSAGNDVLVGDHGKDALRGMAGDDWLRGDIGNNDYDGGPGNDTASFATELNMNVSLTAAAAGPDGRSSMHNIENVVGSVGVDNIRGNGFPFASIVRGLGWPAGQGSDRCTGFPEADCGQSPTGGVTPAVIVDASGPDPGVIIVGGAKTDAIRLSGGGTGVRVSDSSPLATTTGCSGAGTTAVSCAVPGRLDYVAVFGMGGDDSITSDSDFGATTTAVLDGGAGSDRLTGGPGAEILNGGIAIVQGPVNGATQLPPDQLDGGGGDDALLSAQLGPTVMHGGPDIAGFAQIDPGLQGVIAQIGGEAREQRMFGGCVPSQVSGSNEILEGTDQSDVLLGNSQSNALIIGHGGDDLIKGLGGADGLRGDAGRDTLLGGGGADFLDARDGERDRRIDCGPGGFRASRDRRDPAARGCQRSRG
jgi:Ca2+-binding RTX toxin-like protein